jgi:hypothetical protein
MKTLTIRILDEDAAMQDMQDMQDMQQRFINTWKSGEYAGEFLTFESPAALFRAITPQTLGTDQQTARAGESQLT